MSDEEKAERRKWECGQCQERYIFKIVAADGGHNIGPGPSSWQYRYACGDEAHVEQAYAELRKMGYKNVFRRCEVY
jgi:hypothetical protein